MTRALVACDLGTVEVDLDEDEVVAVVDEPLHPRTPSGHRSAARRRGGLARLDS